MAVIAGIFAEVSIPSIGTSIEVLLPTDITVLTAIERISEIVKEKLYTELDTPNLVLYSIDKGEILNEFVTIMETPVEDACRLAIL